MKVFHFLVLIGLLISISCSSPSQKAKTSSNNLKTSAVDEKGEWIQLFNGKNLDGWTIKFAGSPLSENYKNTFRVEDGLLKVVYDEYETFNGEFGHLFYNTPYSKYKLRIEYRFVGDQVKNGPGWAFRNSGAMLHSQAPESMELDQPFPVSIEAQLLGGDGTNDRPTANLCTPGTNVVLNDEFFTPHCTQSSSKTYHGDEWVTVEFIVLGDEAIHHLVEDEVVLSYALPTVGGGNKPKNYPVADGTPLKEGYIALQAESHPVEFRKVELMVLD